MKTLVIAEKPDMGRNIAAVIEPKARNKRTHLEGEQYIITWAIGHLISLAEPDKYDVKYKKWQLHDLPILPRTFKLVPYSKTRDQLQVIADLAKHCNRLVNACDAGREGQYIFYLIQQHLKLKQPVQRLWISDLTPETIRNGFAQLRDGAAYEHLTKAAKARSEADWLIGMNGTRAFTTKHQVLLSVGRVQTPVLALIYDRQKQMESFVSQTFYSVIAAFQQDDNMYNGHWQGERIEDQKLAQRIVEETTGQPGRIEQYDKKESKEYPPKLYDLTLLQRDANAKFGFSAKKTLDVAQALYEKHKVISYPRTNSNYVTEQNIPEMHRALECIRKSSYNELASTADKRFVHRNNAQICNPARVEDHHAILPTHKQPGKLGADEAKLYELIVRRFLSHFHPPAVYTVHTILTVVGKHPFKTTIKERLQFGWKILDQKEEGKKRSRSRSDSEEEETEIEIPFVLDANSGVSCVKAEAKEKQTQPPKPYTEGTLLKAMESAGRQVEDEQLRDAMKDSGLGTPATRAATIERLKQVGYIQMSGKRIAITQKGRTAIEVIRRAGIQLLTSPEMTGMWEKRLHDISRGLASDEAFMEKVRQFATMIVDKVRVQQRAERSAFGEDADSRGSGRRRKSSIPRKTGDKKNGSKPVQPAGQNRMIAPCPRSGCGGSIILGRKGYGCTHYKAGCGFVIWKESFGKTLTEAMVRSLLTKGRTSLLKFKDADKGDIKTRIVLADPNTGSLRLE
ncbi:type IA DNA topoisomerase [Xylanibacillus composti]|uniref:DNA topoisomerase n=1 Tax=Xylanibacillus composti TaxID=1572762 RepID=A0A8J4H3I7_9BACL|nr:type IA DNA topoisomerase [Xylanibacillus composti]MDT9727113.1 type IA DNA topoisomerase [Xylanibacillus composti]GIQ68876.1 DNA topoisomerase [Xylanibacillus composti]